MITVHANPPEDDPVRVTLTERVIATHPDEHHAARLNERPTWATIDAERLESRTDGAEEHRGLRPIRRSLSTGSSRPVAITLRGRA